MANININIIEYAKEITRLYNTGETTEHSFRPALKTLLEKLLPTYDAVNEPKRVKCGSPDYVLLGKKDKLPHAYLEAKDLFNEDLGGRKENKEQFDRYKKALSRIVFTDYLVFKFYTDCNETETITLLKLNEANKVFEIVDADKFESRLKDWSNCPIQTIGSPKRLAEIMAYKALMLKKVISDIMQNDPTSEIHNRYEVFKSVLMSELDENNFADVYAQTITYGMFAARLNDPTPEDFSRQEAATLIPLSNPFLRNIFQQIAGYDLDERLVWVVDDLVKTFAATDMDKVMGRYRKNSMHEDPLINFYEEFLKAYSPDVRERCGVYYTPPSAVNFIVRAVDEILMRDFGLPDGLADESKFTHKVQEPQGKKMVNKAFHRVQILDPATGTGTFFAEAVRQIYKRYEGNEGLWPSYVEESLRPRLHGFELLMAPYTIAHLKLDMTLRRQEIQSDKRLRVYLTNSLEECHPDTGTFWAQWLSNESAEANAIKRDCPVMVMLGNPPYSGVSNNKGKWIANLVNDYKQEPGKERILVRVKRNGEKVFKNTLEERKTWLDDDYVKFTRLGEYYINRNKTGILAFINNNGFLDNPTFRGMRWHLLQTFDDIYILNLHGNSSKGETTPDGKPDDNVFDIMVGVSINIYVKTGKKPKGELAKVHYAELYGKRADKYKFLKSYALSDVQFETLKMEAPSYFFAPVLSVDDAEKNEYAKFVSVKDIFKEYSSGSVSANDNLNISYTEEEQNKKIADLLNLTEAEWRAKYNREKDSRDWRYCSAKEDANGNSDKITEICYRPFDTRYTCYTGKSKGLYASPQTAIMSQFIKGENIGLLATRINATDFLKIFVSDNIVDKTILSSKDNASVFPLYIYDNDGNKHVNLNLKLLGDRNPEEFFYYIYAVLHSPSFRDRYYELLKLDFPRIPLPSDDAEYERLATLGKELCELHLMKTNFPMLSLAKYPVSGEHLVDSPHFSEGKVFINNAQYFDGVSETVWNFYIGGYQPAQKWLKERKGRKLSLEDIKNYKKLLAIIERTLEIMNEIG